MDKQLTIEEGNRLISEFMGETIRKDGKLSLRDKEPLTGNCIVDAKYHSSWDWLMPACHKWDCLTDAEIKEGTWPKYERLCDLLDRKVALYEIQPVWNQLVKNIQWYNSIN